MVAALNLHEVVLAGPPDLLDGELRQALDRCVRDRVMAASSADLVVRMSPLGDDVVLVGAAVLVLSGETAAVGSVNAASALHGMPSASIIGATKVLGAVVDSADGTSAAGRPTSPAQDTRPGADGVLASATAVLDGLALRLDGALPSHIGIGVCGIVDRDRGAVSHAVNLGIGGDWFPLADRLADRTGATVLIENDVNAATWGAHVLSGVDDLAYLSIGTGLAAGFVLSGSLRRGAHGAAAEIGHLPVDPDGPRCSCGQRGCLELSASGSTLAAAWPGDGSVPPAAALFAAAAAGNTGGGRRSVTASPRGSPTRSGSLGLAVGPAAIIIGGGVANVGRTAARGGHRGAARPGRRVAVPHRARPGRPGKPAAGRAARRRDRRRPDRERLRSARRARCPTRTRRTPHAPRR